MPPLLIHLAIRGPTQQQERADDEQTADNGGARERGIEWWGEELVDEGDDEDCEECGDRGQDGASKGDEDEEGTGESLTRKGVSLQSTESYRGGPTY